LKTRVLIAEDEPHLLESLSFILGREGYEVGTALDGEAALAALLADPPALMILDVMLPKINGFELLRQIRADGRLKALPVIILTAKGQTRDRETAAALGADLFLTKPFANKDVVAAVKTLAGG
jgi:DNA-binding response OmpR family regulator